MKSNAHKRTLATLIVLASCATGPTRLIESPAAPGSAQPNLALGRDGRLYLSANRLASTLWKLGRDGNIESADRYWRDRSLEQIPVPAPTSRMRAGWMRTGCRCSMSASATCRGNQAALS